MKYKQGKYPRNINMESIQEIYIQGKYLRNVPKEYIP